MPCVQVLVAFPFQRSVGTWRALRLIGAALAALAARCATSCARAERALAPRGGATTGQTRDAPRRCHCLGNSRARAGRKWRCTVSPVLPCCCFRRTARTPTASYFGSSINFLRPSALVQERILCLADPTFLLCGQLLLKTPTAAFASRSFFLLLCLTSSHLPGPHLAVSRSILLQCTATHPSRFPLPCHANSAISTRTRLPHSHRRYYER